MSDCLFCKIATHEIKAKLVYENEVVVAFHDINPKAPTHILVIPKQHIATLNDISSDTFGIIGSMTKAAQHIAKDLGHAEDGFRLVMNCNKDAGQTVFHIHLHLLAGRTMDWPPG
jgi:histidine triad (HIT) family protein